MGWTVGSLHEELNMLKLQEWELMCWTPTDLDARLGSWGLFTSLLAAVWVDVKVLPMGIDL